MYANFSGRSKFEGKWLAETDEINVAFEALQLCEYSANCEAKNV